MRWAQCAACWGLTSQQSCVRAWKGLRCFQGREWTGLFWRSDKNASLSVCWQLESVFFFPEHIVLSDHCSPLKKKKKSARQQLELKHIGLGKTDESRCNHVASLWVSPKFFFYIYIQKDSHDPNERPHDVEDLITASLKPPSGESGTELRH